MIMERLLLPSADDAAADLMMTTKNWAADLWAADIELAGFR